VNHDIIALAVDIQLNEECTSNFFTYKLILSLEFIEPFNDPATWMMDCQSREQLTGF
jgi:hypothetical protein